MLCVVVVEYFRSSSVYTLFEMSCRHDIKGFGGGIGKGTVWFVNCFEFISVVFVVGRFDQYVVQSS